MNYRTNSYSPIFNREDFLSKLELLGGYDNSFHLRILETVLLPFSAVTITKERGEVCEIKTPCYRLDKKLYTCVQFLEKGEIVPNQVPSKEEIVHRLYDFPKIPYLLGGTTPYPVYLGRELSGNAFDDRHRKLFGIDCSGLLYFVTNGHTPRNTSQLMEFGEEVKDLKPLDIILFTGHVIIYLGNGEVIESREKDGVIISKWEERRKSITKPYKYMRFYESISSQAFGDVERYAHLKSI